MEQNRKSKHKKSEFVRFPGHSLKSVTDKQYEIYAGNGRIELKMCKCAQDCDCKRGSARLNKMTAQDGSFSVNLSNVRKPRKITFKQHRNEIYSEAQKLHKRALKAANRMKREQRSAELAELRAIKAFEKKVREEMQAFLSL